LFPWHRLQLESVSGPIEVLLAARECPEIELAASSEATPAFRALMAFVVLEPLVKCLDQLGIQNARCVSLTSWPDPQVHDEAEPASWFTLNLGDGRRIAFRPLAFPDLMDRLAADGATAQRPVCDWRQGLASVLRWPVTVRLATVGMNVEQVRSLVVGDVVVTSLGHPFGPDSVADVRIGDMNGQHAAFVGSINDRSITAQGVFRMSNPDNAMVQDTMADPNAAVRIDELSIPVHFQFDAPAMCMADIESLRPGYVMELESPVRQVVVRIVAFGQSIGTAELVVVGDRLGARILHLAEHHEQPATH
jgi:type III secretion protein Q